MYPLVASFSLFFLVGGLVCFYHLLFWNETLGYDGRSWVSSFECGFVGQRLSESYFSYVYFGLLVFFVVFDLEVSLLLNMPCQGELFKNLVVYLFFIFLLCVGFSVEVYGGYVEWSY